MSTSPRYNEQPPCYCLYSFVYLPASQLPASGSALQIAYYKKGEDTCEKVKRVTFAAIRKQEPEQNKPLPEAEWGILGVEGNFTPSKSGELASELQKLSKCIVTVGEMQKLYSTIIVTPLSYKGTWDCKVE